MKRCTKSKYRKLSISEHQDAIDAKVARLSANPDAYGRRRALVEHPFETIKADGLRGFIMSWFRAGHRRDIAELLVV